MMKRGLKFFLWTIVVIVLIQFIPIDRKNPSVDASQNFIDVHQPNREVIDILQKACYDCHSNETQYPQYAYIAPISWLVKRHVNDGRTYLNFSIWEKYNQDIKTSTINKIIESVDNRTMPLPSYINYHPESNLTEAERKILVKYFEKFQGNSK